MHFGSELSHKYLVKQSTQLCKKNCNHLFQVNQIIPDVIKNVTQVGSFICTVHIIYIYRRYVCEGGGERRGGGTREKSQSPLPFPLYQTLI